MTFIRVALLAAVLPAADPYSVADETELPEPSYTVNKIWNRATHNAFTDLIHYDDKLFCTFRESAKHNPRWRHQAGRIRVIVSSDEGRSWQSIALVSEPGVDLRDSKLSITPDGRMMMLMHGAVFDHDRLLQKHPRVLRREQRVALYDVAAQRFGASVLVQLEPRIAGTMDWLWRVTWHDGAGYGIVYQAAGGVGVLHLVRTVDCVRYELVQTWELEGKPNEATIRFRPDGEMLVVIRNDDGKPRGQLGRSPAPYHEWTWCDINLRLGGPDFIRLPDGTWILASRDYTQPQHTVIGTLSLDGDFQRRLILPSRGDTGYPGLVVHDEKLWISYYSEHGGRASIYLAQIPIAELAQVPPVDALGPALFPPP